MRAVVLAGALGWFLFWGIAVFDRMQKVGDAEAHWFEAERAGDSVSAGANRRERKAANSKLVEAVGVGFVVPLVLLLAAELVAGARRLSRSRSVDRGVHPDT